MGTVRKSITFTEKLSEWVQTMVARGEYANESEYVRDLVRRDRAKNADFLALQAEIQKGLDSGISDKSVTQIMKEVEDKMRADGRL